MTEKKPRKKVVPAEMVQDGVVEIDFARLFERIAGGHTLQAEADSLGLKAHQLVGPIMRSEELSRQYQMAEMMRAMMWADQMVSISDESCEVELRDRQGQLIGRGVDNSKVHLLRLRIDTRWRMVSKLLPRFKDDAQEQLADALGEMLKRVAGSGRALQITERASEAQSQAPAAGTIMPKQ